MCSQMLAVSCLHGWERELTGGAWQAEGEAVHLPQQHDQLRYRLGLKDQPGTEERPRWQSPAWLLLPPLQPRSI